MLRLREVEGEPARWAWSRDCSHRTKRRDYQPAELAAGLRRFLRRYSERVADGDLDDLAELAELAEQLARAIDTAAVELVERQGFTLGEVGSALGITKQAAAYRYSKTLDQRRRTVRLLGDEPASGF